MAKQITARHSLGLAVFCLLASGCSEKNPTKPKVAARIPYDTGVEGLPEALLTRVIEAESGDTVRMTVNWVYKWISGNKVRMLGYDKSIPGPTLKVPQGATITLLLTNETGLPTSLHSHGVRLDNKQDGMPGLTQAPIDSGQTHAYTLHFPDPGVYWYHPHMREDYGIELGLYGNYLVTPRDSAYWPPVHREAMLMLDDIMLEGGAIRPFYKNIVDHALMGRFGNAFLVNGDTAFTMHVKDGEVIRFYATNAASARVFKLAFEPARGLHVVGADNGRYEYSSLRESDIIAPSERLVFQVSFKREIRDEDTLRLYHSYILRGMWKKSLLATFVFDGDSAAGDLQSSMEPALSPHTAASIDPFRDSFQKRPDRILEMTGTMDMTGVKKASAAQHDPENTDYLGIEWSDEMGSMSTGSHAGNTRWILRDDESGKENHDIDWAFKTGDKVLIRVYNDRNAVHAMPHPLHFHGQRFLVVKEQGKSQKDNLVWRDSYLIGLGFTVELLLDAGNPGDWMMHCHIPEHLGAQMMGHFRVSDQVPVPKVPHIWTLGLQPDAEMITIADDTAFAARAAGEISGQVNNYHPSILGPSLAFRKTGILPHTVTAALDNQGRFRFAAAELLGGEMGPIMVHITPTSMNPGYRPIPHKIRLSLNRADAHRWSVDVDLAGDASFTALHSDTSAQGSFTGDFSGKVNGFDPAILQDTIFFVNVQFPKESTARAQLGADGSFRFDAFDVLGGTDGIIFVEVMMKAKNLKYHPVPGVIKLVFERVLGQGGRRAAPSGP